MNYSSRAALASFLVAQCVIFSGCDNSSKNEGQIQSETKTKIAEKATPKLLTPGTATSIITLKGVPFDQPNVKDDLKNLCVIPEIGIKDKAFAKLVGWCIFNNGSIPLPDFSYGNLPTAWGSTGYAKVNNDGALVHFSISGSKGQMLELATLLEEKYGKPLIIDEQISNRLGTKFDKKTFTWIDSRGTKIALESIYDEIDQGRVEITSASFSKAVSEVEQVQRSLAKDNL